MRVIAVRSLAEFWQRHPDAERPLRAWYDEVTRASWQTPAEVKAQFGNASILGGRRVVFNIKGNRYRLVAALAYNTGILFIKFVGTHAEYDRIDAETVEWR
jgi:mRNA interferase HigB